jgi:dTDP-4-amino-4,6-dideoxygalactose transaminase
MKIEFYKHNLGKRELVELKKVFNSIFLSTGPKTAEFEKKLAKYLGVKYVVGTSSGTAALHLALLALNIGPGDEVITTPFSFVATANAILYVGAKPVFVDVEKDTGNIDASLIEKAITKKTKAIIPVHLYGQMCDMKKINKIAKKYKLKVVEDAAHCLEGKRDGIRPGQLSDLVMFSFYATKNITSGEGGAIATNDKNLAQKIRVLGYHGIIKGETAKFFNKRVLRWDLLNLGWKYNMFDIQAALLLSQIPKIEERLKIKEKIAKYYDKVFNQIKEIQLPKILPKTKHARHLYPIWVNKQKRDGIVKKLKKQGINVVVQWPIIHLLSYYRKKFGFKKGNFKNAESIGARTISLPFYPKLTKKEIDYVIKTVKKVVEHA